MYQQQQIMMNNFGDQLDYYGSDGESVISDTMVNGQVSPSRSDWSPVPQCNTWNDYPDQQDFSNIFTDALTNGTNNKINFNNNTNTNQQFEINTDTPTCSQPLYPTYGNINNAPNLNKESMPASPLTYETMQNPIYPMNNIQQHPCFQTPIYNREYSTDLNNYLPENMLLNNTSNMNDDFNNVRMDDLLNTGYSTNNPFNNKEMKDTPIFSMNQSTMNNKRHELFLQMIKQQQNKVSMESLSIQSSPAPLTPSSDWDNIPSPVSEYDMKPLHDTINKPTKPSTTALKPKVKKPRKSYAAKTGKPRLFRFLKDILEDPNQYKCIEWVNKSTGTFKFLDSSEVARLWGHRKNKPAMKYENFARSLRTYIAKGILKKPRNKLVYCFAQPDTE
ncbi:transcription factor ast-1-like [Clytia hemisphaerica]|uniref:ETS domain-containing protein n=1 Tax=Clytia hemisphaerica TaxID=252671 RepID=A0A7M5X5M3_9CNID|eukprot:TCONS_00004748-protein